MFSALFGALAGIVFDLFSHTAKLFKHKKKAVCFFDGVYCILCFVSAVLFLLIEGNGKIESYVLFGTVLGALAYFLSISTLCKRFFAKKYTFKSKK